MTDCISNQILHNGFHVRKAQNYKEIQDLESKIMLYQVLKDPKNYEKHLQRSVNLSSRSSKSNLFRCRYSASVVTTVAYGRRINNVNDTMIVRSCILLAAFLLSFALADVKVTGPAAGDTITGLKLDITWEDSGTAPKLSALANYQLFLCAGGNDDDSYVCWKARLVEEDTR